MKKGAKIFILICISAAFSLAPAQDGKTPPSQGPSSSPQFSRPQIIADLNPRPMLSGHVDCDENGTIYTFVEGYAPSKASNPSKKLALLGIHPDGSVANFNWHSVSGFVHVYTPRSVFVGYGNIYVLARADRQVEGGKRARLFVVLTFNSDGSLVRTTILPRGIDALVLGVFKSGNMVIGSRDQLNNRMAFDVIQPDGTPIRQFDLGTDDYLALASNLPNGPGQYDASFLIASSTLHPFGANLLLVPTVISGLPIISLSEQGVVKAIVLKVQDGTVLDQYISSTPSIVSLRLGNTSTGQHPQNDSEGKRMGMGIMPSQEITVLSLTDGSILHQTNIGSSAVQPVCESGGALRLLTSSGSSGMLAVTSRKE